MMRDRYFENSLKVGTCKDRGLGERRKVTTNGILPSNWVTFLRCSENKKECFPFLSENTSKVQTEKLIITTVNEKVISNQNVDLEDLMPCNIEESDERMLLHTQHAARTSPGILIKTIDSYVIVIAIAAFHKIEGITELWIEFGKGKTLKYLPIHETSEGFLGIPKSRAMPFSPCTQWM